MPSIDLFAVAGLIMVFLLLGLLMLVPTTKQSGKRNRRKERALEQQEKKDWQAVSTKLERHIYSLRKEIDGLEKKEKTLERELLVAREKNKLLQEKLSQERKWQSKETDDIKKKTDEVIKLKKDIKAVELNLEREHSQLLAAEREARQFKDDLASVTEEKRLLGVEVAKSNAKAESCRKEMVELREMNAKLSKKHDEATWIAKSEYDKLEKQIKEKDKELAQLKEKLRRELL